MEPRRPPLLAVLPRWAAALKALGPLKIFSALTAAALVAACGVFRPAATPTPRALRVGLVTDVGQVDDKSFNQSAWEGAQAGAHSVGGSASYIETMDAKDYAPNIQQYADQGYDVIVTVGFALGQATQDAARKYPAIKFIGVDQFQSESRPNLTGLIFHEDQAGYLAGVLAAKLTKTGTIAAVLGTDLVPPVVAFKEGYEHGAKATDPDITLIAYYHPGTVAIAFDDPEWGATTAVQALDQDADVIFGAGGRTSSGALLAAAVEAQKRPGQVYCIGVDADQWETFPEARACLVSSALKRIAPGVAELIQLAKVGRFPGGNYYGRVGLAPYHDFDNRVPSDVKALITKTANQLESGQLTTGYQP